MRALILVAGAALAVAACHDQNDTANQTINMDDDVPMSMQPNVQPSPNNASPPTATEDEEPTTSSTADDESSASTSSSADEE